MMKRKLNNLLMMMSVFLISNSVEAYSGYYLSVGGNPTGQRMSKAFGSTQDVIGGGGEIEFGKRKGGIEYAALLSVSSGEAKNMSRTLNGDGYQFGASMQSLGLGMRLRYRFSNNFYVFLTPQLRAVVLEDDGANEPEEGTTAVTGQIYNFEESYLGYGSDIGLGYTHKLGNGYVEDVFYQLSYSINNYLKNYGEYQSGEDTVKINRSVGSNYYDQSVMLTVGFTFGDGIVQKGQEAYQAVRSRF